MKKSFMIPFSSLVFLLIFAGVTKAVEIEKNPLLITSLPITQLLVQHLADGTDIVVDLVVPATFSMSAQESYFKKNSAFKRKSAVATACVTVASAWKGDSFYPFARRNNIKIVELDATSPVDRTQAGVQLLHIPQSSKISPYVWRAPANVSRMVAILGNDLQRLFPGFEKSLQDNLRELQRRLFQLRTEYEVLFAEEEMGRVVALTDDFIYLTNEFGIEISNYFLKEEIDWTDKDYQLFSDYLKKAGIKAVLCKKTPGKKMAKILAEAKVIPVVYLSLVSAFDSSMDPADNLLQFFSRNLETIHAAVCDK